MTGRHGPTLVGRPGGPPNGPTSPVAARPGRWSPYPEGHLHDRGRPVFSRAMVALLGFLSVVAAAAGQVTHGAGVGSSSAQDMRAVLATAASPAAAIAPALAVPSADTSFLGSF